MSYFKIILTLVCLASIWLSFCNAKPARGKNLDSKNKISKSNIFFDILGKRGHKKCDDLLNNEVDLKAFSDEVAYAFLSTGNIQGLDELLKYLVDSECFSLAETIAFRSQLVTIYDLIHNRDNNDAKDKIKRFIKRDSNGFDYYSHLNSLIDELAYAYKTGSENSDDLVKYMVEYILSLEQTNQLNISQSSSLLNKIKEMVSADKIEDTNKENLIENESLKLKNKPQIVEDMF